MMSVYVKETVINSKKNKSRKKPKKNKRALFGVYCDIPTATFIDNSLEDMGINKGGRSGFFVKAVIEKLERLGYEPVV